MQVRRVRVQLETSRLRISGVIQLPTEGYRSRTTDFLNAHDGFIALTDAEVESLDGTAPASYEYAAVGTRHIVALVEVEDLGVIDYVEPPRIPGIGAVSVAPPEPHGDE